MKVACKYTCEHCPATQLLPEDPLHPTPSIRAGCENCGYVTTHHPVASPYT